MKSLTVKLKDDKHIETLTDMLKAMNFVDSVTIMEDESELNDEEIAMVEERWVAYKKNPKSTIPWSEVKSKISKKHGL